RWSALMRRCSQRQVRNIRCDCNVRRPRSLARRFRTRNLPNPEWKSLETSKVGVRRHQPSTGDFNDGSRKLYDNLYLDRPIVQDEANARRAALCKIGGSDMSFSVKGDYFETWDCDVS